MKKRKHLSPAETAAMKEDIRIAMEYPVHTHARGAAIAEIAERYGVSRSKVWVTARHTRRARTDAPALTLTSATAPAVVTPQTFELKVGDVCITATSKTALLAVVERLLVAKD